MPGLLGANTDGLGQGADLGAGKKTNDNAFPQTIRVPKSSGNVLSLRRRAACKAAPSEVAHWPCGSPCSVDGQPSTMENGQPLGATTVNATKKDPSPGPGDTSSRLTADTCRRLKRKSASTEHPRSRTRCTVVAKDVERTATGRCETKEEEEDEDDGRDERERAPSQTAGDWKW